MTEQDVSQPRTCVLLFSANRKDRQGNDPVSFRGDKKQVYRSSKDKPCLRINNLLGSTRVAVLTR
jgi:hypothetical protein